jgi:ribosomal protein S18 acetylase RimI-like enzyme
MLADLPIRQASSEDFESIAALNIAAFVQFAPTLSPESWQAMQRNLVNIAERSQSAQFLIHRQEDAVVGSVAYCPAGNGDSSIFRPDMASALLLAVHPRYRGKGLAKALMALCISKARNDGAADVGLFTSELMSAAHHLYQRLGFQLDVELPRRHGLRYFRYVLPLNTAL